VPTVPTYDSFQATPNTLPQARIGMPEMPDVAGQQAQQLGRGMSNLGQHLTAIATDMQREANATVAKDIDVGFTAETSEALYNPESGYMVRQGKDAVLGFEQTVHGLQDMRRKALDAIQSPAVRQMVEPVLNTRLQHALDAVSRHSGQENRKYQIQTANDRTVVSYQDAAMNYADDGRFAQADAVAREETATLARLNGWDEATAQLQATKYRDHGFKMRYEAWRMNDPAAAFAHYRQHAEQISPLAREQIGAHLFHAAAPVLAAQYNAAGGSGVTTSAQGGDPTAPRGLRNNNPGNVMKGGDAWQGEVQGNDPRYATFASPEAGIRAMGKTLLTYQDKHGLNTVEGIIARWAPATENNTVAYAATVAKEMGVKPGDALNLHDGDTLAKLTRAMIRVENGSQPYTDQQIATGLAAATKGSPLPKASASAQGDPTGPTGYHELDTLPADWRLHVLQLARSQAHQQMSEARESLRGRVQDATAAYLSNGFAPDAPNEGEFIRAYGQAEGVKRYADFQGVAKLGQTLQQVKTLPTAALVDMVKTAKPTPGDGFAVRQQNYNTLVEAIDQVQKARAADPVAYAIQTGSYGVKPIERFNDPKTLTQEITRRASVAGQIATDYGTPPQLLTNAEAKVLSGTLKALPVEQQKVHLAALYQGVGDMGLFKQTMQGLAPDNPTLAVAGIYQARGLRTTQAQDVADLILRGQAILTPNKKEDGSGHMGGQSLIKMPEEKLLLATWTSETGDAFKGKEHAADLFLQTSRAIYAARSAEEGDYSGVLNSKRWKSAINLATGGIQEHNGASIVMPYGMPYDKFQNALQAQAEQIVKAGGALNTTPREMLRLPLENVGDGCYLFRRGAGYLVGKDGRPVVVELNGGR
jgi:hypothetical protein